MSIFVERVNPVNDAVELLKAINPAHELVRFWNGKNLDERHALWEEFVNEFKKPGISEQEAMSTAGMTYIWVNYLGALELAVASAP